MNLEVAAASFIQAERILRLETPLGPDVLLPERFELHEAVSDLFLIQMSVRSMRTDLKPEELVGKMVDVSVETGEGSRRTWNGLVVRLSEGPLVTRGLRAYHLTIRPKLWLMSQRSDCRIWQDKTSVEVAQMLCSEHGLEAPKTQGIVTMPKPQHYSVQFNETDLAYLTRRLEEDGIFYWFEHEGGQMGSVAAKHTLVLANHEFGYAKSETPDVRFAMGSSDRNHISKFEKSFSYVPGKRSMADWNFLQPNGVPQADTPSLVKLPGNDQYDLYEYPSIGGYGSDSASEGIDRDRVEAQSKLRMQAAEAEHNRVEGQSSVRTLAPGSRFTPYDVSDAGNQFDEHVVIQIVHVARDRSYETNEGDPEYVNRFLAIPSNVPATPHRTVPRPRCEGTQIAIIAGPQGEEIHTDQHGRVKVWFPWDRRAKKDGSDTCWIRVVQNWAGRSTYGGQILPRCGMEAAISHIDGDFDKPLVVGLVPNTGTKLPYEFPTNKTRSTFRTNTYKGSGFNEFTFEDKTGEEIMFYHAQKDHTTRVLNTRTARVDRHDVYSVGGNRAVEVAKNQKHEIGGSYNLVVGGTGPSALGALTGVMSLAGQTSSLLQQAGQIAGGGGPALGAFGLTLASSALGFLSGGGLKSREGVVSGPTPRKDSGVALTASGTGIGEDAGGFFPLPGIMNTIVQSFQSTSVGVAQVQQIGMSRVTNVGQTDVETIGKQQNITIGEKQQVKIGKEQDTEIGEKQTTAVGKEQYTQVGKKIDVQVGDLYNLVTQDKFHGEAKTWEIFADNEIRLSAPGGYITINKKGIKLYALKIDIEGNRINFKKGGPGKGASCMKKMSQSKTPFVRGARG